VTESLLDSARMRERLLAEGLVPEDALAVFCVGSVARGWANPASDYDICIISAQPHTAAGLVELAVPLNPGIIPAYVGFSDGRRWELKYWTDGQVDQMLSKVTEERFASGGTASALIDLEEAFLERVLTCVPIIGDEWIHRRRKDVQASAYREFVLSRTLGDADGAVEDALGQLSAGDPHSAVLSTHKAFVCIVNALLESAECYGSSSPKWRSRRMRDATPQLLPYQQYWAMETMAHLDLEAPEMWVTNVVSWCKQMSMEIEV
jgi:hypothetical protein